MIKRISSDFNAKALADVLLVLNILFLITATAVYKNKPLRENIPKSLNYSTNAKTVEKELIDLRKYANDKITIELFFSRDGKIYLNNQPITPDQMAYLMSFGFQLEFSKPSLNDSLAYHHYTLFCNEGLKNGYQIACKK